MTIIDLMKTNKTQQLKFSINHWSHLYSLQTAISHLKQLSGRKLSVNGRLQRQDFLDNIDTNICIEFLQSDCVPDYARLDSGEYILGSITKTEQNLASTISVDRTVFEELRKNLMEYADIDGIHIVVTLEVLSESDIWKDNEQLNIIQLDYAMKGD